MQKMTRSAARRTAIAATGLDRTRPGQVTARHLKSTFARMGLTQIDSVSRVVRSQYLPYFSRLGPYPRETLDRLFYTAPRMGIEYWAHAAAFVPPETWRHFDRTRTEWWRNDYGQRHPDSGPAFRVLQRSILDALGSGPKSARGVADLVDHAIPERNRGHWGWNPSQVKIALEALFAGGIISAAGRNDHFERIYALPHDVSQFLPQTALSYGTASQPELGLDPEAERPRGVSGTANNVLELTRIAARALGIARPDCLADYFRQRRAPTDEAIASLLISGELIEVDVEGTRALKWHAARTPRSVSARALLAPFDPLVFYRPRIEWLFDFHYRIEIYTPAKDRVHGYYVLPFLVGERLVGRVDLHRDQASSTLRALKVTWERGEEHEEELILELREMAKWLGLGAVDMSGTHLPLS
ncbi:MAG: winged helix DNA-binding domain-containing protein [Brevibacterium sp.]|uniref:winged helix-turn-helix domain-containing protein n=1 Tax=Brevibacterium sp. TaxID=1701 RepID=UPI002649D42F|nr:crosslink repair DNA glycosylase YcaQ family protein [Brevibacterium sp.]MDN5806031.1 winged helix DNA-binding domain-containing protein [Brevibacterium sp.]MDN5832540.1 winged helix DNA-binding domain-containing protein [Brevibacterium sp.]MDN5875213.1 winged helix DNA-binding domain-containing protein [Brevibacterium sp.]MDN5908226.1 winged helix DNA-binding domain-containing protein [Brevibacterium sp.]MDN6156883.1 winged helix DNA-binding domain-containing protein [Brevibacterium sp.]